MSCLRLGSVFNTSVRPRSKNSRTWAALCYSSFSFLVRQLATRIREPGLRGVIVASHSLSGSGLRIREPGLCCVIVASHSGRGLRIREPGLRCVVASHSLSGSGLQEFENLGCAVL